MINDNTTKSYTVNLTHIATSYPHSFDISDENEFLYYTFFVLKNYQGSINSDKIINEKLYSNRCGK